VRPNPRLKLIDSSARGRIGASRPATARRSSAGRVGSRFRLSSAASPASRNPAISSVTWPLRTDGTHRHARPPPAALHAIASGRAEPTRKPNQSPGYSVTRPLVATASTTCAIMSTSLPAANARWRDRSHAPPVSAEIVARSRGANSSWNHASPRV